MRRRELLALGAGAALLPIGADAWAAVGNGPPKRLVVVLLRGAMVFRVPTCRLPKARMWPVQACH